MKTTLTKLVAALLLGMVTMAASAQRGYQVKGIVVDDEGPVAGATVVEQGTFNGISTGADGAFTLTVGGADVLVEVSCIGYTTVVSKASLLPQIVTLTPDNEYLDEVVVIGYGEVRKSDLTGSVVAMKPSELNRVKANTAVAPRVDYRGDYALNYAYEKLEVYGADEFREEYIRRGWDAALLGDASSDWQKAITQTAFNHRHTVSLKGALPHLPYRVSLGFQDSKGAVKGNKQDMFTASLKLNPVLLDRHLLLNIGLRDTYKHTPEYGGSISDAAMTDPTRPIYTDYGPATVNGVSYDKKAFGFNMFGADATGGSPISTGNEVAEALGYVNEVRDRTYCHGKYQQAGKNAAGFRFSYGSHSGSPVGLYVTGAGSEAFTAVKDNAEIAPLIAKIAGY